MTLYIRTLLSHIHHFVFFAVFLILGIWSTVVADYFQFCSIATLLTVLYVAKIYFQFDQHKRIILLLLPPIFFVAGIYRVKKIKNEKAEIFKEIENKPVNLKVIIQDVNSNEQSGIKTAKAKILWAFADGKNIQQIKNKVIHFYLKRNLKIGQIIKFRNLKIKLEENEDFNLYALKENIFANVFIYDQDYKIVGYSYSFEIYLSNLRHKIFQKLKRKINPQTFSFFSSIFLGNKVKSDHYDDLKEKFGYWGISHYLARSGLHVLIIIILINFFFAFLPISIFLRQALSVLLIIIYSLLSWSSISFARSIIMFFLCQLCLFLYLPIQTVHIVTLTTISILLGNPFQLFFLDFQLSFALTFFLALYFDLNRKKSLPLKGEIF